MRAFIATVLSVIATGTMLIAYGLLAPRAAAPDPYLTAPYPRAVPAAQHFGYVDDVADPRAGRAIPVNEVVTAPAPRRVVRTAPVRYQRAPVRVERAPKRDWTKTAMVIGGSTAAGAGLGAIFGGKKGALIGAALGGGAGTIYEVRKR